MNYRTSGVDQAICQAAFLFFCIANKQVLKMPAQTVKEPLLCSSTAEVLF